MPRGREIPAGTTDVRIKANRRLGREALAAMFFQVAPAIALAASPYASLAVDAIGLAITARGVHKEAKILHDVRREGPPTSHYPREFFRVADWFLPKDKGRLNMDTLERDWLNTQEDILSRRIEHSQKEEAKDKRHRLWYPLFVGLGRLAVIAAPKIAEAGGISALIASHGALAFPMLGLAGTAILAAPVAAIATVAVVGGAFLAAQVSLNRQRQITARLQEQKQMAVRDVSIYDYPDRPSPLLAIPNLLRGLWPRRHK